MPNHRSNMLSLTVTIAAAAVLAVATPARAEDAIVKLVSAANGKCLQPINGSHNQGDAIVQVACNGSAAQQWTVHSVSSTKVHLINRASGLCLDARGKAVNVHPYSSGRATASPTKTGASALPTTCCRRESLTLSAIVSLHQENRTG